MDTNKTDDLRTGWMVQYAENNQWRNYRWTDSINERRNMIRNLGSIKKRVRAILTTEPQDNPEARK